MSQEIFLLMTVVCGSLGADGIRQLAELILPGILRLPSQKSWDRRVQARSPRPHTSVPTTQEQGWLCWTVNSVEAGAQSLVQDLGCLLRKVYPVFNVEKGGMQLFSNEKLGCCICPLGDCSYKPVISITRNGRRAVRLACSACRRLWPSLHPLCPLPALPVYIY